MDVGQQATTAAQGGYAIALTFGRGLDLFVKGFEAGKAGKVAGNEFFGLDRAYFQLLTQLLRAHAIDEAKVDGFGVTALVRTDLVLGQVIDEGGSAGVDILALAKGLQQSCILRHMGQHAQLCLRVVGGNQSGQARR